MVYLVECEADKALVKILTSASKRDVIHGGDKGGVLKSLLNWYESSTGMIDEDPGRAQPRILQKFREERLLADYGLKILHHTAKNNHLIVICPRLEEWILGAAREADIDPERYNLPNDPVRLHAQINIQIDKFEKLVKGLVKSTRLKELKTHLK